MAYLVVLVGFKWPWGQAAKAVRSRLPGISFDFVGRDRPLRWEDRKYEYRDKVAEDLVDQLFGKGQNVKFCRADGTCAQDEGRWSRANCKKSIVEESACARRRPEMLLFVCAPDSFELFFEKFGRAGLFICATENAAINATAEIIAEAIPEIAKIRTYLANLSNSNYAPRVPLNNFQEKGGHFIAMQAQANLTNFCETMEGFRKKLYSANFQNYRKKYMRGAYMLDERIGFQRDRLHSDAQVGAESRANGYHLLNAFHMYGVPVVPGYHLDVSPADGNAIGWVFEDILNGQLSKASATHVNVTPCDRLL